jgi:glycine hydroxymethyltransferase
LLCKKDVAKKIDSAVFPGEQGGPLMHVIAGKAIAFKIARSEWFKDKQVRTLEGAKIIAEALSSPDAKDAGIDLLTGGTDVHLLLVDLRKTGITGVEAQELLESANVTTNKNAIPFDPLPPAITSGVRIGTPALATRGFGKDEFLQVGKIIKELLINGKAADIASARAQVRTLTEKFPLYASLG